MPMLRRSRLASCFVLGLVPCLVLCLVFLAGFLAGCAEPAPDLAPVAELTPLVEWGETFVVPSRIDLGKESAERYLGHGWSSGPEDAHGDALWGVSSESHLRIPRFRPSATEIVLRGRSFVYDGAPPQSVEVRLNGESLGRFDLDRRVREIRLETTAEQWTRGENLLVLDAAWTAVPRNVGAGRDRRKLAAAWYEVELSSTGPDAAGRETVDADPRTPRAEDGRIFLPWNGGLDVFLQLPPRAALGADAWSWRGDGVLRVEVQRVGEATRDVARLREAPPGPVVLDASGGLVRLGLRALPPTAEDGDAPVRGDGGVLLSAPRILAPQEVVSDPPAGDATERATDAPTPAPAQQPTDSGIEIPEALVVFMVDTLRADHLGPWAGDHVETPEIDAFAAESVVFDRAVAQSPWTRASVGSLFTGLWPPAHGAFDRHLRLAGGLPTLASLLSEAGWQTIAFVDNPNVAADFGFDRGFERFVEPEGDLNAEQMNGAIDRWLGERDSHGDDERPLFLYVHTLEPHSPYNPPAHWRERVLPDVPAELARASLQHLNDMRAGRIPEDPELLEDLHALYHAEVTYADHAFGAFLDLLAERGLGNAAVLFLSDHGEEFLEHGNLEHGRALHVESLHVPMILRWPGLEPRRVEEPVQHLDVLPTLLGRLGVDPPPGLPGDDVLAPVPSEQDWEETEEAEDDARHARPIYSHLHLDGPQQVSVRQGRWKLIHQLDDAGRVVHSLLYDVESDPLETRPVGDLHPVRRGWLATLLRRQMATGGRADAAETEIDSELRKSLEALGYL